MVVDIKVGLLFVLQDFFVVVQNLVFNLNIQVLCQLVLLQVLILVVCVFSINDQLVQSSVSVNSQIIFMVISINFYVQQIVKLNQVIVNVNGIGGGQLFNDLLDQCDQLVFELNKYVKIIIVLQDIGVVSVFIGIGQVLVMGDQVIQMVVINLLIDVLCLQIGQVILGGGMVMIFDSFFYDGGSLGGLFKYCMEMLDLIQNVLGCIVIVMGMVFNQ